MRRPRADTKSLAGTGKIPDVGSDNLMGGKRPLGPIGKIGKKGFKVAKIAKASAK